MSDNVFIDTNIIVYAFDSGSPQKKKVSLAIIDKLYSNTNYFISTQVIQEFSNVALLKMKPPLSEDTLIEFIDTLPDNNIVTINTHIITNALHTSTGHSRPRSGIHAEQSLLLSNMPAHWFPACAGKT